MEWSRGAWLPRVQFWLKDNPYFGWSRSWHDMIVESNFDAGLWLWLASPADPDAVALLSKTLEIIERIEREGTLQNRSNEASFPWNRGNITRLTIYIHGVLGEPAPTDRLGEAARDCFAWIQPELDADEDDAFIQYEHKFHTAQRLALLGGDREYARLLIRDHDRPEGAALAEREFLRTLAYAEQLPIQGGPAQENLRRYFDRRRGPHPSDRVARFEIGLLWDMYVISPDQTVDWPRAMRNFVAVAGE